MSSFKLAIVDDIVIRNVLSSSTFQIGESEIIEPRVKALAVQKEYPVYSKHEGDFWKFPIFYEPIAHSYISEDVQMNVTNEVPIVKTGNIKITSLSAASVFQVGNTTIIDTEARIKHFRRFFHPPAGYNGDARPVIPNNE